MNNNYAIEKNMPVQFMGLNKLRGIAAIFIFLHHSRINGYIITSFGDCFVSFFFILSGFLSTASADKRYNEKAQKFEHLVPFMMRKIQKIYPLYLLCLILALIVKEQHHSIKGLLLNAAMLQSWIPNPDIYFSGNSVSWFVSSLMFCYFIFIPMFRLMKLHHRAFVILSAILYVSYISVLQLIPDKLATPIIYISPVMQFLAFLIGMILWDIFMKYGSAKIQNMRIMQKLCIIIIAAMILLYCYVPERYSLASYWWPIWAVNIFVTAQRDINATRYLNETIWEKCWQIMGRISFQFYMLHTLVIAAYARFCHYFSFESPIFLTILVTFVATLCSSLIAEKFFDAQASHQLKDMGKK